MNKPITNAPITPITFEQRLKLVQGEVVARVMTCPTEKHNTTRARLWCGWINKNVLEGA